MAACAAVAIGAPVSAASAVVTVTSTTLAFNVVDITTPALGSVPAAASARVKFTTTAGGGGGTVMVNPTNLPSMPAGSTLDARNFTLTCAFVSGSAGFVAAPPAVLNGPTLCGTLVQGQTGVTSRFTITLTLDDTTGATVPFDAASFFATFTVTATAT